MYTDEKEKFKYTALCGSAPQWLHNAFLNEGVRLIEAGECRNVLKPVSTHIDLMALNADDTIFVSGEMNDRLKDICKKDTEAEKCISKYSVISIAENLSEKYPLDIPLNAVCLPEFFICNTKTVSPKVLEYIKTTGREIINVRQGYTKCSTCIVSNESIITEDESIYNACKDKLQTLLIKKGEVSLPGFDYGFIGGASARVGNRVYFFGNLDAHPDAEKIKEFVNKQGADAVSLSKNNKLLDIGSILIL